MHLLEDCNLCAIHAKRVTISKSFALLEIHGLLNDNIHLFLVEHSEPAVHIVLASVLQLLASNNFLIWFQVRTFPAMF